MKAERQICSPMVNTSWHQLNWLQRSATAWLRFFLHWERWASPNGDMREWLRQNTRVSAWLLIPTLFVMPVIGLILWQLTSWLTMLSTIAGKLIILPILILVACVVIRIVVAFFRR